MYFEWSEEKNRSNIQKHGIDFQDVMDLFNHPYLALLDDRFDYGEERWIAIGRLQSLIGVVAYTERVGNRIRIISARKATRREVSQYEQIISN